MGRLVEPEAALKLRIPAERHKEDNLQGTDCDLPHCYHHSEVARQHVKTGKKYIHTTLIKLSIVSKTVFDFIKFKE